ncbi:MAG TPA: glucose-6-phosphate dehydrogenase assembly protein OpcA [Chroococcales cyanobacterium]
MGTNTEEMRVEEETTAFLSGKLAQVDIMRIERELKHLWRSATHTGEGHLVTRACAMNLVLYSEDADAEISAGNILDEITTRHPCRAILAIRRQFEKPRLEAWVSARCHLTDSKTRKQIWCEQITVVSEGTGPHELASVVRPLVIPDLPVHLWWRTAGLDVEKMEPFFGAIDELIVDSAQDLEDGNYLIDLANLVNTPDAQRLVAVADLNWRRTYTFREGLALAFSQAPEETVPANSFDRIKQVEIRYGGGDKTSTEGGKGDPAVLNQALLYLGWMASRLGWRATAISGKEGDREIEIKFANLGRAQSRSQSSKGKPQTTAADQEMVKELSARLIRYCDEPTVSGALCSVRVSFADGGTGWIYVDHPKGMPGVQVRYGDDEAGSAEKKNHNFTLTEASESRIIDDELESTHRDPSFEPALTSAVEIKRLLKSASKK